MIDFFKKILVDGGYEMYGYQLWDMENFWDIVAGVFPNLIIWIEDHDNRETGQDVLLKIRQRYTHDKPLLLVLSSGIFPVDVPVEVPWADAVFPLHGALVPECILNILTDMFNE